MESCRIWNSVPLYMLCTIVVTLSCLLTTCEGKLRFSIPAATPHEWQTYNNELRDILHPIHTALGSDILSPDEAGDRLSTTMQDYLLSKPEFNVKKSSKKFIQHKSKRVEASKNMKKTIP